MERAVFCLGKKNLSPFFSPSIGGKSRKTILTGNDNKQLGFLRGDHSGIEGLYQVTAQVRTLVYRMAAGPGKFYICGFGGAAEGGY